MHKTQKRREARIKNENSIENRPAAARRSSRPATKKAKPTELHTSLFNRKAVDRKEQGYTATRKISELPVHRDLIANLSKRGYEFPTEIQDKTLEASLKGRNLMGIAQTGTGKTGAFLIPIIDQLIGSRANFQALVVVPTRELAVQVEEEFKHMAKGLNVFSSCFIGGVNIKRDLNELKRKSHVVIGTPGRLNDLMQQRVLRFENFQTLVLDEFDRLLDMGFIRDIRKMVDAMPNRRQTFLFSATEESGQRKIIDELLDAPVEVKVSDGQSTGDHIDQESVHVGPNENKFDLLVNMLNQDEFNKVLVFAETKRGVSALWKKLNRIGLPSEQIHGNKSQSQRLKALQDFKSGRVKILLATDVAARGLDITEVSHVINYQAPKSKDAYIHRIGRTGRAGKSGKAYTFIS
ncbi:MAG: DEAD/DEAH box helicase [Bacteroidetes bacterium]|nr:DEAD/DEAH box helicase [Bacteroidota bacterium]